MILVMPTQWKQMDGRGGRKERTDGRSAPGGASLAAFHVWGVLFNWFPTFFIPLIWFGKKKMPLFDPFSFLSKKHVFSVFQPCSDHNRLRPGFRHCSRFVPVFLPPRLVSKRSVYQCLLNKTKNSPKCVRVPPVLCAMAINNGDKRSVLLIGRYMPIYWQYPNAIST